jgi:hypothetical protein
MQSQSAGKNDARYLILIGYGRDGRFDGFTRIVTDAKGFDMAQNFSESYDDDDFQDLEMKPEDPTSQLASLLMSYSDYLADLELENTLEDLWTVFPDYGPFQDCVAVMIFNSYT